MGSHSHTFRYKDAADFVTQLEQMRDKLYASVKQEPYLEVRARYPHLSPSAFTNRLTRFPGAFPHRGNRHGITHLFVTTQLHKYLSRPRYARK